MKVYNYNGPFATYINDFVNQKRKLGSKYNSDAYRLFNFDQYIKNNYPNEVYITKEIIQRWLTNNPNNKKTTITTKAVCLRQFSIFMNDCDSKNYILLEKLFSSTRAFVPYIFTDKEIQKIISIADNYKNNYYYPKQFIVSLVFRLLYGTGMRISECLTFKIKDIDLTEGIIIIKDTKNGKDRLIVLTNDLKIRCQNFNNKFNENSDEDSYFFRNEYENSYKNGDFTVIFKNILRKANLGYKSNRPNIHSFRHTFAMHSFKKIILEKKDINTFLPILSAYLGHTSLKSTEKYLRLTADMYDEIRSTLEKEYASLINILGEDYER